MLAHPVEDQDVAGLDPAGFLAEWKWDGIRVQIRAPVTSGGARLYSRTGDDISARLPDMLEAVAFRGVAGRRAPGEAGRCGGRLQRPAAAP